MSRDMRRLVCVGLFLCTCLIYGAAAAVGLVSTGASFALTALMVLWGRHLAKYRADAPRRVRSGP